MPSYIPMDVFGVADEAMPGFADVRLTTVMGGFVLGSAWAWLGLGGWPRAVSMATAVLPLCRWPTLREYKDPQMSFYAFTASYFYGLCACHHGILNHVGAEGS